MVVGPVHNQSLTKGDEFRSRTMDFHPPAFFKNQMLINQSISIGIFVAIAMHFVWDDFISGVFVIDRGGSTSVSRVAWPLVRFEFATVRQASLARSLSKVFFLRPAPAHSIGNFNANVHTSFTTFMPI